MAILGYGFACEEMNVTVTGACFEGPGFEGRTKPDFLWRERDLVPWVALLWLPQPEPLSDGLGGSRTAPELGQATAPPEGAEQGPGARPLASRRDRALHEASFSQ